ncbi:hypothetical protein [Kocuria coralli]|uniref:hypothetical protein n=1 Tax=Kocuria coralli TaxID=1461025 RepID=UPI0015F2B436|nr:hypothetical protein [Kocuria coralli]
MQQNDPQSTAAGKGGDSISMSPDEEREFAESNQDEAEPADEGVGAMTDEQDIDPATEN